MKALGLNQAYKLLKLRNVLYSVNIFIGIDNRKYITAMNKKFINVIDTKNDMDILIYLLIF